MIQDAGALQILNRLQANGMEAYVVGGAVRDSLLGRPFQDVDLAAKASPGQIAALFSGARFLGRFGTVQVPMGQKVYEVTCFRTESGYTDARHPDQVCLAQTIRQDLSRRDFTVNAMAWDGERLVDPFLGQKDLQARILRCVGDPKRRFCEDSLRVLRLFRFESQLDFCGEAETQAAALLFAKNLAVLPGSRVREELVRALMGKRPSALEPLLATGALLAFGLPGPKQSLAPLDQLPQNTLLRVWALLHLLGGQRALFCQSLGFSKKFLENLAALSRAFFADCTTDLALRRLLRQGLGGEPEQVFLAFCAVDPGWNRVWPCWQRQCRHRYAYTTRMLALRPASVVALGARGEQVGDILQKLLDAVIEQPQLNEPGKLFLMAKALLNQE
ncbi:MAG: hypothetical protein MSH10_04390 [Pygmaiobacter massiliensis]|nr:hypothetical protein [Pygmaiobacter massiliensis]